MDHYPLQTDMEHIKLENDEVEIKYQDLVLNGKITQDSTALLKITIE